MKSDESFTFDELRNLFDRRRAIEPASNCECENGSKSCSLKLSEPGEIQNITTGPYQDQDVLCEFSARFSSLESKNADAPVLGLFWVKVNKHGDKAFSHVIYLGKTALRQASSCQFLLQLNNNTKILGLSSSFKKQNSYL